MCRANVDLEQKIRTDKENLILIPKMKQLFLFARLTSDHMFAYLSPGTRAYAKGGLGLKKPLSLIFYKNFITCTKGINCFRMLVGCTFVDLMQLQIPRNGFACKFQGTL